MMPVIHHPAPPAYVVPGPRTTDAIGAALRGAYRGGDRLPEELAALIGRLDRVDRA